MSRMTLAVAGCAVVMMSGCASILNDKTQTINVAASNGASISGTVDGQKFTAPGPVTVTRTKAAKVFTADSPECAQSTVVNSDVDPKFWLNIIIGGGFGSTTDYSTEKMWHYSDNVVISCGQETKK